MISLQDIPGLDDPFTPTAIPSVAAVSIDTPEPAAGIPQSSAPDLSAFGESPWITQEREDNAATAEWQGKALSKIDQAALDPEKYFKGADLSFARTPQEAYKLATIDAFLQLHNNGEPLPENELSRKILRQDIALSRFDGKGATDDGELYTAIREDAQGRIDRRALATPHRTPQAPLSALPRAPQEACAADVSDPAKRSRAHGGAEAGAASKRRRS